MYESKYVIGKDGNLEMAVLFNVAMSHKQVADRLFAGQIVSAGFCRVYNNEVTVWGESMTMNVKSRFTGEDERSIRRTLGLQP